MLSNGSTHVGCEDDEGLLEDAVLLERLDHLADGVVEGGDHAREDPPVLVGDVGVLVDVLLRHLQRAVHVLERQVQEQGDALPVVPAWKYE